MDFLYHGSKEQNLKVLKPFESGHEKNFVYAVTEEAFATIFINRPGGSLVASWGRLKDKTPYYCELREGILERNYSKEKGSVYLVDKSLFRKRKDLWKEEFVTQQKVKPLKEKKIDDLKEHLLKLESEGKLKIIPYKDRKKYFPKIDEKLLDTIKKLIDKYGYERVESNIKKYNPEFLDKLKIHKNM